MTAWRGLGGTSRGSPLFQPCWWANDLSYSRHLFPNSPALRCCGTRKVKGLNNHGRIANWRHGIGSELHSMEVSSADKYEGAFKEATKVRSTALSVTQHTLASSNQKRIVDLAAKNRLPAMYYRGDFVESGGLMSYGADQDEPYRRAAVFVDKILKGAARRPPRRAAEEVRVHHQSEGREADRINHSTKRFRQSRSSDR